MKNYLKAHWAAIAIYLISLIIGIFTYADYGISMDEESQREFGIAAYEYAIGKNPGYTEFSFRDHSPGFEWPLIIVEKLAGQTNFREIFLMRHLVSYIIFISCMMPCYFLTYRLFNNKFVSIFALIALIFSPMLFAHAFFNPKDTPALAINVLCLAMAHTAFSTRKQYAFFVLGLLCGYSGCIRIMNLVIIAPVLLLLFIDWIYILRTKQGKPFNSIISGFVFMAGTALALYASWPALWVKPLENLAYVYGRYSNYHWIGSMLFNGEMINSTELPWYYIPVWFIITTPEIFVILGIIGLVLITIRCIKHPAMLFIDDSKKTIILSWLCFALPLAMVIIMKPVLYDSWRHMFFIYAPFIIIMAYALNELLKTKIKKGIAIICILQVGVIMQFMIRNHPFQQVYFNHFVSHKKDYLYHHYELDYWGVSNLHALEWLAKYTDQPVIHINQDSWQIVVRYNWAFLAESIKERFVITDNMQDVDYHIEFFRTSPYKQPVLPESKIIHEEYVLNSPIYRIVKMR